MEDPQDIMIDGTGRIRFVYSDLLDSLFADEERTTTRASYVEPATYFGWEADGWLADMRPSGGPLLHDGFIDGTSTKKPFATRAAALAAEREWLRANKGL